MKIAYLILAHNTPNHIKRLCKSLSSDSSHFFIHLDKKANEKEFVAIQESNVTFVNDRIPVFWGDFSQVDAILTLLKKAFFNDTKFDRFVLLSGSDFPLRTAAYIESFFHNNRLNEYINLVEMPADEFGKPISRLTTYRLRSADGKYINGIKKILMYSGVLPRKRDYKKYMTNLVPYGGSTWWGLTHEAVGYILNFTNERPDIVNFFKNTVCPDESFFQTILGNSSLKLRIKGNLTYTDWSAGGPSPANISEKHLSIFTSKLPFSTDDVFGCREILFARKFTDDSARLVSTLESQIIEAEDRLKNHST